VAVVLNMTVPVVDVVDMVVVRHGYVPASQFVLVVVAVVRRVTTRFALVDVITVDLVQVTVVDVVDVIVVRYGHVSASQLVLVTVVGVLTMFGGNTHVYPRETCRFYDSCNHMYISHRKRYSPRLSRSPSWSGPLSLSRGAINRSMGLREIMAGGCRSPL
jgi:hypothetical protein